LNQSEVKAAVSNTVAHLRYLYSDNEYRIVAWTLFGVPGVAIAVAATAIGYVSTNKSLGPVLGSIVSIVVTVLFILSVAEAAPMMPIQVAEGKHRYSIAAGYAWSATALALAGFIWFQVRDVWAAERAGSIQWMPEILALMTVCGLAIVGVGVSTNRMPAATHAYIMQYVAAGRFAKDKDERRSAFYRIIAELRIRSMTNTPLDERDMKKWKEAAATLKGKVRSIEKDVRENLMIGGNYR
jgi:hypothetical protein